MQVHDGLDANGRCQMRFTRAWATNEHHIFRILHKQAFVQWSMSTILTARRQLSWPVEAGNEFDCLCA